MGLFYCSTLNVYFTTYVMFLAVVKQLLGRKIKYVDHLNTTSLQWPLLLPHQWQPLLGDAVNDSTSCTHTAHTKTYTHAHKKTYTQS